MQLLCAIISLCCGRWHTYKHTNIHKQSQIETDKHTWRHTHTQGPTHTNTKTETHTNTHKETHTHTNTHTETPTLTNTHTETPTHTNTHTGTPTHTITHALTHTHRDPKNTHTETHTDLNGPSKQGPFPQSTMRDAVRSLPARGHDPGVTPGSRYAWLRSKIHARGNAKLNMGDTQTDPRSHPGRVCVRTNAHA